jgi:hypothetical protein
MSTTSATNTRSAGNGSVLVHDTESAMVGPTAEDVHATLGEEPFARIERLLVLLQKMEPINCQAFWNH